MLHAASKVEYQIVSKSISNVHTSLKGVPLCGSEYNIHLLVCKVLLQKLLIFKTISGACDHAHVQFLDKDLHRHHRVGIGAIQY